MLEDPPPPNFKTFSFFHMKKNFVWVLPFAHFRNIFLRNFRKFPHRQRQFAQGKCEKNVRKLITPPPSQFFLWGGGDKTRPLRILKFLHKTAYNKDLIIFVALAMNICYGQIRAKSGRPESAEIQAKQRQAMGGNGKGFAEKRLFWRLNFHAC